MKFFWYLLFGAQPWILLLAMMGFFGKEAEEAANEMAAGLAVVLLVILVAVALFLLGQHLGFWAR